MEKEHSHLIEDESDISRVKSLRKHAVSRSSARSYAQANRPYGLLDTSAEPQAFHQWAHVGPIHAVAGDRHHMPSAAHVLIGKWPVIWTKHGFWTPLDAY